jgi:hypothetical protein
MRMPKTPSKKPCHCDFKGLRAKSSESGTWKRAQILYAREKSLYGIISRANAVRAAFWTPRTALDDHFCQGQEFASEVAVLIMLAAVIAGTIRQVALPAKKHRLLDKEVKHGDTGGILAR